MDTMTDLLADFARRADAEDLVDVAWTDYDSPVGTLVLAATPGGLVTISYRESDEVIDTLAAKLSPRVVAYPRRLDDVRRQLDDYFAGRLRHFDVELDWRLATPFQRQVLGVVREVGFGEVTTYHDVAKAIGRPSASRAAGGANARNPLPIVVPCHRVIGSDGSLTGYGGGIQNKAFLLEMEGSR
jgi:methylated-DNA-[protein]-cysteine S-methyltransferase